MLFPGVGGHFCIGRVQVMKIGDVDGSDISRLRYDGKN